jgi:hypothetical protein
LAGFGPFVPLKVFGPFPGFEGAVGFGAFLAKPGGVDEVGGGSATGGGGAATLPVGGSFDFGFVVRFPPVAAGRGVELVELVALAAGTPLAGVPLAGGTGATCLVGATAR